MTADEDPEMFLTMFERAAERESWPKEQWAGLVAPYYLEKPKRHILILTLQTQRTMID